MEIMSHIIPVLGVGLRLGAPYKKGYIRKLKTTIKFYIYSYVRHLNWRNKQEDPSSVLHEEYDSTQETDDEQEKVKDDGNDILRQEEVMDDGKDEKGIEDAKLMESDKIGKCLRK